MKNNKVCLFTTFYSYDNAYSLCICVEDQIRMFVDNGYKIKVLVDEAFTNPGGYWSHPNVTYGFLPAVSRSNDGIMPDNWKEQSDKMYDALKKELEGFKVCITHDIILQPAHIIFNLAARKLADKSEMRWMHWLHSPTQPQLSCNVPEILDILKNKFPKSFLCYPNDWDRKRVALNFGVEMDEVKCVHHPSDFCSLLFGDVTNLDLYDLKEDDKSRLDKEINYSKRLSKDLIKEFDILDADVISSYPCRLDRGKQPEFNIKTMAAIKKKGRTVRMIIFDFHSTGGDKVVYREDLKRIGREWGLTDRELIFISEWRPETNYSVPREFVMNMRKISDFHMHPSNTETYSLVVQEAMAARNFCVLNYHLPVMQDIYGNKNCLYEPFGASVDLLNGENGNTTLNINDEQTHFDNLAGKVLYFIENNPVINQWRFIRQKRSINYIFKQELEPLLFYEPMGKRSFGTPPR